MFPLIFLPQSPQSTNEVILNYHSDNQPTLGLYTFHQLNGKGQYGNKWHMPKDKNLAYSFLIPKSKISIPNDLLNFHTALIVRDFLANLTHNNIFVKWPNDIIINRKKVCGILIESIKIKNEFYYIIGIGINVLQKNFEDLSKAGSIYTQTSQKFDLSDFSTKFHRYFSEYIIKPKNDEILNSYNTHLFGKGIVSTFLKNEIPQNGIIQYADEKGFIWIDLEQEGLQKFFHKEIEMLY